MMLRELWSAGRRHAADALVRRLTERGLDIASLAGDVADV